jgi:hypothetical protein
MGFETDLHWGIDERDLNLKGSSFQIFGQSCEHAASLLQK